MFAEIRGLSIIFLKTAVAANAQELHLERVLHGCRALSICCYPFRARAYGEGHPHACRYKTVMKGLDLSMQGDDVPPKPQTLNPKRRQHLNSLLSPR